MIVYSAPEERETAKSLNVVSRNAPEEGKTAKSLNLVVCNVPEEGETAKPRQQAFKPLATKFSAAVDIALNQ